MTGQTKMSLNEGRTKRVKSTATGTETIYRLVNRDKTKIGVISHATNCGYTDEQLKDLAKRGWKIKVEERKL